MTTRRADEADAVPALPQRPESKGVWGPLRRLALTSTNLGSLQLVALLSG